MEIGGNKLAKPHGTFRESEQGVWKIIKLSFHCFIMNHTLMVQHNSC